MGHAIDVSHKGVWTQGVRIVPILESKARVVESVKLHYLQIALSVRFYSRK